MRVSNNYDSMICLKFATKTQRAVYTRILRPHIFRENDNIKTRAKRWRFCLLTYIYTPKTCGLQENKIKKYMSQSQPKQIWELFFLPPFICEAKFHGFLMPMHILWILYPLYMFIRVNKQVHGGSQGKMPNERLRTTKELTEKKTNWELVLQMSLVGACWKPDILVWHKSLCMSFCFEFEADWINVQIPERINRYQHFKENSRGFFN